MSPTKLYHSAFQSRISRLLPEVGMTLSECAVKTAQGTKVADVAWASDERWAVIRDETAASVAPEICVEIISTSNTKGEIKEKRTLYLAAGAQEVWTCDKKGVIKFYNHSGEMKQSKIVPHFPLQIKL
jgi:Uma2 family endonuclease